ncbi:MAG TPA: VOC family protein [Thermoanaerobaculia bacterium]|nr:VOC family protein [Thermoanaerobaculia bacterium]
MPVTTPYLFFNGNCAEAMKFYEKALGGTIKGMLTYADTPPGEAPPNVPQNGIMHAYLTFDGGALMASDDMTENYQGMHGVMVAVAYRTADEATRIYNALSEGGTILAPIGKTFWSQAFGMFRDRFGTPWMVYQSDEA